jgi:hypothetical protein
VTVNFPNRASLHRAIDELKPDSLIFLAEYIEFLRYREQQRLPPGASEWEMKLADLFASPREEVGQPPIALHEKPTSKPVSVRSEIEQLADELDRIATGEHRWVGRDEFGEV